MAVAVFTRNTPPMRMNALGRLTSASSPAAAMASASGIPNCIRRMLSHTPTRPGSKSARAK